MDGKKFPGRGTRGLKAIFVPDPTGGRRRDETRRHGGGAQPVRIVRVRFVDRKAMCCGIEVMQTGSDGAKPQRSLVVLRNSVIALLEPDARLQLVDVKALLVRMQEIQPVPGADPYLARVIYKNPINDVVA